MGVLVETLLERGTVEDVAEAESAIERLARSGVDDMPLRELILHRLRALAARARKDEPAYVDARDRYRQAAESLGFVGQMEWAENLPS